MDRPNGARVTVIVTTYNGERWIRRTLESVFEQSFQDYEVVLVDDASSDGTRAILQEYQGLGNVRCVLHSANKGIPATRNSGLREARGEYVAFLEQDDEWFADKLREQVKALDADPELDLVFTAAVWTDPQGRQLLRQRPVSIPTSREETLRAFFSHNPVTSVSSVMMRRKCIEDLGGFDERYSGADDYDLWLRVAETRKMAFLDTPLLRYRVHDASYSWVNVHKMLADGIDIVERAVQRNPSLKPFRKRRLAQIRLSSGVKMYEAGSGWEAMRCIFHALRTDPSLIAAYPLLVWVALGPPGRVIFRFVKRKARFRGYRS